MAPDSSTEPADDAPSLDLTPELLTGRHCCRAPALPLTVTRTWIKYNAVLRSFSFSNRGWVRAGLMMGMAAF